MQSCVDRKLRHDARLVVEHFRQSAADGALVEIQFGEIDEEVTVPRFGFAQVRVEGSELRISGGFLEGGRDQPEALAAAGLCDARNQQPIEKVVFAPRADPLQQRVQVGILAVARQHQASILDEPMDLLKVVELFASEFDHQTHELSAIGIVGDQRERIRGGLALAGRVVEQKVVEAVEDDFQPLIRSCNAQLEHLDRGLAAGRTSRYDSRVLEFRTPLRGRLEQFKLDSTVLRGNALGDPHSRAVTVYLPPEYDRVPHRRFPVFVDLAGFMGSGPAHVGWKAFEESVPERLERLVRRKAMGPVIAVFPDCWTRLGGNQYINSSAVGNYADHLVQEVVPQVDDRYRTFASPRKRAVFGKSSGGYGAMIQGMKYARHWAAIACHSGDLYFDFCYRSEIPRVSTALAEFGGDRKKFLKAFYARRKPDGDTHTLMFLAMAAFYDPDPKAPLGFQLPMDLQTGEIDEKRWARWLRHDPIELAKKVGVQKQLRSLRGIYFDCGTRDQYHLHYGARILHKRLREARISHHYEEFDDDHTALDYRLDVSLPWLYEKIMPRRKAR